DADAYSGQASLVRKISIRLGGQTADAESSKLILRIVAGDDFKHTGSICHRATQWPYASIQRRANHSIAAHQFLRWRQSNDVVVLGRMVYGSPGLLSDGACHQVRCHGRSRAAARGAGGACRVVRVTEWAAEGTSRVRCSHFSHVRLGQDD